MLLAFVCPNFQCTSGILLISEKLKSDSHNYIILTFRRFCSCLPCYLILIFGQHLHNKYYKYSPLNYKFKGCLSVSCFVPITLIIFLISTCVQNNCRLTYNANGSLGWYYVAIQVEDFISSSSTVAMSSVPVQFLVQVLRITPPPKVTPPTFVGTTPEDGGCIKVGSTYQQQITARSGGRNAT